METAVIVLGQIDGLAGDAKGSRNVINRRRRIQKTALKSQGIIEGFNG